MGDLHISSRQSTFKLVKPQVIPGADEKDSPIIGPLAHESLSSVGSLLEQIGQECDVLAVVGDIYDHVRNLDPGSCVSPNGQSSVNTVALWNRLGDKSLLDNEDYYPKYIDLILFMEKIYYFYRKFKKPVIGISGNHEAYDRPYGISPYIGGKDLPELLKDVIFEDTDEFKRANEGLPADHNLTRYEATLLYGPSFGELGVGIKDGWNFKEVNFDLFYCLLTPWSDIAISYDNKHSFLCLGWGVDESIIGAVVTGGGSLPVARASMTSYQIELLKDWAQNKKGKNIVLSHFTFACYEPSIPFNDEGATIYCDAAWQMSPYAWGSFFHKRGTAYNMIFNKEIDFTISGHTHRAGVYSPKEIQHEIRFKVAGRHQDTTDKTFLSDNDIFLTCGSAGPYAKQNYAGEFLGQGLQKPQGMIVNFEGVEKESRPSITWVESAVDPLPRLAVVIEYMDNEKGIFPFLSVSGGAADFTKGRYLGDAHKFYFTFNPEFVEIFRTYTDTLHPFTEFSLHARLGPGKANAVLRTKLKKQEKMDKSGRDLYALESTFEEMAKFESVVSPDSMVFMSINLNGSAYLAKYYNVSSPICFPIILTVDRSVQNYPIITSFSRDRTLYKGSVARHADYANIGTL